MSSIDVYIAFNLLHASLTCSVGPKFAFWDTKHSGFVKSGMSANWTVKFPIWTSCVRASNVDIQDPSHRRFRDRRRWMIWNPRSTMQSTTHEHNTKLHQHNRATTAHLNIHLRSNTHAITTTSQSTTANTNTSTPLPPKRSSVSAEALAQWPKRPVPSTIMLPLSC